MVVKLLYFAAVRDIIGDREATVTVEEGTTAEAVWSSLKARYEGLRKFSHPPMFAVNESYAAANTVLREGDELAFIPPVAGG